MGDQARVVGRMLTECAGQTTARTRTGTATTRTATARHGHPCMRTASTDSRLHHPTGGVSAGRGARRRRLPRHRLARTRRGGDPLPCAAVMMYISDLKTLCVCVCYDNSLLNVSPVCPSDAGCGVARAGHPTLRARGRQARAPWRCRPGPSAPRRQCERRLPSLPHTHRKHTVHIVLVFGATHSSLSHRTGQLAAQLL
jgi:hypothetical protein